MGFAAIAYLYQRYKITSPTHGICCYPPIFIRDTGFLPPTRGICCYPPIFIRDMGQRYRITPTHPWVLLLSAYLYQMGQRYRITPTHPWSLLLSTYLYQRNRITTTHLWDLLYQRYGIIPSLQWELLSCAKVSRGRERWIRCMCNNVYCVIPRDHRPWCDGFEDC